MQNQIASIASIPMQNIGPLLLKGDICDEVSVPLATFETPLWASTNRGAKVARLAGGINVTLLSDSMCRSIILEATSATEARKHSEEIKKNHAELQQVVSKTSRFAKLIDIQPEVLGKLIYLRLAYTTGDASGHNMVTKASDAIQNHLIKTRTGLRYVSISGNTCCDKKVSAINAIQGRGKSVIAEVTIPKAICEKHLRTTPAKVVDLHIKKNLVGSILAGSLRSANAHFANMLLAAYLATGQDAANIVEGSQGITHCEQQGDDLYFCVKLPNVIVGTVGNGKHLDFVQQNLLQMGCHEDRPSGQNSQRLAMLIAATVLCCELSLLAAQTNPGELMRAHTLLERKRDVCRN